MPAIGSARPNPQGTTVNLTPTPDRAPPAVAAHSQRSDLYGSVLIDQLEYRGGSGSNIGA